MPDPRKKPPRSGTALGTLAGLVHHPSGGAGVAPAIEAFQAHHAKDVIPMWRESFEHGVGIVDPHPISEQERYFWSVVEP